MLVFCAFASLSAAWIAMLHLIRSQGVRPDGDEPHYLAEAVSLGRYHTLNLNPGYNFALTHHIIYPWKGQPGPNLAASIGQVTLLRHHLYFPFHAIGLSALLALPMLSGTDLASWTLIVVLAALTVGLAHLTSQVSGAPSPWRIAIAGLFLAPAFGLATTQVYPDLITGLLVAVIVMTIAKIEVRRECTWTQISVVSLALVALPWMDQKNIFFPIPLLVAFLVGCRLATRPGRSLRWVIIPTVVSLGALLMLNVYEFGHLLGGAQQIELFGSETWTRTLALLVDRRQGIFPQLPIAVIGLAGLWTWRKRLPVAVVSAIAFIAATIYGNATQPDNFGGYSFIGRFQWPALPLLLAFAGLYLIELWRTRTKVATVVSLIIVGIFAIQLVPIVRGEHAYYNVPGWDPSTYSGWWGSLDPSPVLGYIGLPALENWRLVWSLSLVVVLCAAGTALFVQLLKTRRPRWLVPVGGAVIACIAVTFPATISAAGLRPALAAPGAYVPLTPTRICDTRPENPSQLSGSAAQCNGGSGGRTLPAGGMLSFSITSYFGVPSSGVTAVALNVTGVDPESAGYFTVYPTSQVMPISSTLNFNAGQAVSDLVIVGVGSSGRVSLFSSSSSDAVVDLEGYFTTSNQGRGGLYSPLALPIRTCDTGGSNTADLSGTETRCNPDTVLGSPDNLVEPSHPLTMAVTGHGGIPTTQVSAVVLEITVVNPDTPGHITVFPADQSPPVASAVNFRASETVANQVIVPVDDAGRVSLTVSTPTKVAVDVSGYYSEGSGGRGSKYTPEIVPIRICDTRASNPSNLSYPYTQCNTNTARNGADNPLGPRTARTIRVAGLGYVPRGATAVAVNIAEVSPNAPGYLTVYPGGRPPNTWEIASPTGELVTSLVMTKISRSGTLDLYNLSRTTSMDVVVDVVGWYSSTSS
jgi:hypothetical protein